MKLLAILATFTLVVAACGKTEKGTPSGPAFLDPNCHPECVVTVSCRKNDCKGELFHNGCCSCPKGTVDAYSCPADGGRP